MTKFTKERLEEIAELARKATYKPCAMHMTNLLAVCDSEVIEEMARQLLASMEQEPVAYMHHSGKVVTREECCDDKIFAICCKVETPLYAAPQLPHPAVLSVSDGVLKSLLPDVEKSEFWFEHNGKYLFEGVRFNNAVFEACRAAMLQAGNPPATPDCWCRTCRPVTMNDMRFVVCPDCGNKRCPHANDHRNACTGSNEHGQAGSAYPAAPQQEVK
ncbi:hypothetical protein [Citrobacter portucalensis]|uniref:hypothetical protein n=1 Tax=Citrobacter portucalensis TaxID=1639133 RepID=UPI0019F57B90|nr:hypothetical protein [Citrobacter portucalensis]MBD9985662.1 hypothetical protein [Citrobacter portucalensis]MBE0032341.1 hypothetical protein [Citrobacter portucalensis]MBE0038406.1 hypothetical protein [Citrobacter portucalensis]MBE0043138.1 hypothetical protein [Citrobacter portucalensis]MBE0118458.1 hypothetical protein [Citrobacter portucalensis]